MDKQLKELKAYYETNIPVSFTDQDKQAVLTKIKSLEPKRGNNVYPFLPKALVAGFLAAAVIFIGVMIANGPFNLSDSAGDYESPSDDSAKMEMAESEENTQYDMAMEEESGDDTGDVENELASLHYLFDPDTVQIGMVYGNMNVTDVQKQGDQTTVVFLGHIPLSGDFQYDDETLTFIPHEKSLLEFPLASTDAEQDIPFHFQYENTVERMYQLDAKADLSTKSFIIDVVKVEYHYSADGSRVYLTVKDTEGEEIDK